jgi:hypothetical protein
MLFRFAFTRSTASRSIVLTLLKSDPAEPATWLVTDECVGGVGANGIAGPNPVPGGG